MPERHSGNASVPQNRSTPSNPALGGYGPKQREGGLYMIGAFTQRVLRGVIRRTLGHLKNKKYFFQSINDHFTPPNTP